MKQRSRIVILALLSFLGLYLLQSCSSAPAKEQTKLTGKSPDSTDNTITRQQVFALKTGELSTSLTLPGELSAYQQVDLYAKVNSFVQKLYVDVGSEVSKGQLLAVMEAPELNSQLLGAESDVKSQEAIYLSDKATYDRLLETSKTPGTISPNDLDIALSKMNSNEARLDAAKAAYRGVADTKNYLEIRAPFNGVITTRNVSAGAYVGPSGKGSDLPLFTLQEQQRLRLVVSVPGAYTEYMKQGTEISFTTNALPDQVLKAKVARLAGALDTHLRSQRVEIDVNNQDKRLLPGMIADARISLESRKNGYVVPASAIINSTLGVYVVKLAKDTARWIPVKTGQSAGNKTEIFGTVQPGDLLFESATEELRDGSVVHNTEEIPAP